MCVDHASSTLSAAVLHGVEIRETINLPPVDSVEIVSLMDNVTDSFMPNQGPAHRFSSGAGPKRPATTMVEAEVPDALRAEHGFSMLVTVRTGDTEHRLLFDAGTTPDGVTENMRRLGIDPGSIEAVVLSHGHFDHTAGLEGLIRTLGRASMPLILHPHAWRKRRITLAGREPFELPTLSRRALAEGGFEVFEMPRPSFLFGGGVLVTGEVGRITGYEPGFPPQQAWLDGQWRPDPLVLDDQAVVINVKDKGLVVLTGCGHGGIVNICRHARALTGETKPVYAALGGFHLSGPLMEPLIPRVVDDLAALNPSVVVPAHCTGWRAACAGPPIRRGVRPEQRRHALPALSGVSRWSVEDDIEGVSRRCQPARRGTSGRIEFTHRAIGQPSLVATVHPRRRYAHVGSELPGQRACGPPPEPPCRARRRAPRGLRAVVGRGLPEDQHSTACPELTCRPSTAMKRGLPPERGRRLGALITITDCEPELRTRRRRHVASCGRPSLSCLPGAYFRGPANRASAGGRANSTGLLLFLDSSPL